MRVHFGLGVNYVGPAVNRHRIESHRLEDGDELQVGKFKLTFLSQ